MKTIKLHDLEPSSIFWEVRFFMTEKDVMNLQRIITSWFDLTRTDLGRKAMEIDCQELFHEDLIFSKYLRKILSEALTAIQKNKKNMNKEQFMRFESKRKRFEYEENEMFKAIEENSFISTSDEENGVKNT